MCPQLCARLFSLRCSERLRTYPQKRLSAGGVMLAKNECKDKLQTCENPTVHSKTVLGYWREDLDSVIGKTSYHQLSAQGLIMDLPLR